ncbi:MAG: ATP-binding protein [Acidobacteriota bacterium]|nr:ATP-binding protein [Acidobacteriota bacterium]
MIFTDEIKDWLPWVIKIRFVIIIFVFAIDYSIRQLAPNPANATSIRYLGMAVILWLILGLFFLMYNQISHDYLLQAYLQIYIDIVIITAILHVTGDLESNYFSLYLLAIIMASILLPRGRAFLVAAVSFVCMGAMIELAYLPTIYPELVEKYPALQSLTTTSTLAPDLKTLQVKISASLFGFFAVAYLSSYLAESLRKAGRELRDKSGQVANLQAKNENIIQSMREGLLSTDLNGAITELNPAGAEILGQRMDELRGSHIDAIFPGLADDIPSTPERVSLLARQEIAYIHPERDNRILGVSSSPLQVPAVGVVGHVYSFQDLTEEKRRDAEYRTKDRMATLGRMAAGIAHEIRNPLASIAGSVKLLQSISELDDDQSKLITIVSRESERLNKLVSDFLLYSRDLRFEFQSVDVVTLLTETLLLLEHHPLFGPQIQIERKFPRRPVTILADADKLRQVFWNICDNSLKAMPSGGTLTVQVEEAGNRVRVTLGDTGVGFTGVQMEKVFEPFQSGFSEGTGLGLALVYQVVQGHQGSIKVDSQPGKGARFLIDLPREPLPSLLAKAGTAHALRDSR